MEATKKTKFLSRKFDMPPSVIEWATSKDSPRKLRALREKLHGEKEERKALKRKFLSLKGEKLSVGKLRRKINWYTATVEELANVLNQFYKDISNLNEDKLTLQGKLDEMERSSVPGKNKALTPNYGENCRKLGKSKKPENSHEKVEGNDIQTEIGFRNTKNKTWMCDILV